MPEDNKSTYTIVFQCMKGMIRLPPPQTITFQPLQTDTGDFSLRGYTSTQHVPHFDSPLPRDILLEVRGPADSLEGALNTSTAIAEDVARQLAFAANAWQGHVLLHVAYDSSAGLREREFVQQWIPDDIELPRSARLVHPELMVRAITAISQLPIEEIPRTFRAIRQYSDALQYWRRGYERYALSHLFMGVETITQIFLNRELASRGLSSREELAIAVGDNNPYAWIRRNRIFHGDVETHRYAKAASDGLEHGFANLSTVQEDAEKALEKTAAHLREALLFLLPLSQDDRDSLLGAPYSTPAKTSGYERLIVASLKGTESDLTAPGFSHPHIIWNSQLSNFQMNEAGQLQMSITQAFTPRIGVNAKCILKFVRLDGPSAVTHSNVEIRTTSGPKGLAPDSSGMTFEVDHPSFARWPSLLGRFVLNVNSLLPLAQFWLHRLAPVRLREIEGQTFLEVVDELQRIIASTPFEKDIKEKVRNAWSEALSLNQIKHELALARALPEGLFLQGLQQEGEAPLIASADKLEEWNSEVLTLTSKLLEILNQLLETDQLPMRS